MKLFYTAKEFNILEEVYNNEQTHGEKKNCFLTGCHGARL